jgi:hypothetical protein
LQDLIRRVEKVTQPEVDFLEAAEKKVVLPAWRQVTEGEPRLAVSVAIVAAITMQFLLPDKVAAKPHWLLPAMSAVVLVGLLVANPRRITRESQALRGASILLIVTMTIANTWSAGRLVFGLVQGTLGQSAPELLLTGGAVWLTNVIVFALWYWDLDRGGPVARSHAMRQYPDFLFTQMASPELAPPDWEPSFIDYFYVSFTNATAFSPTDVLPLVRWAKLTMMLQSGVSLSTVALVIARAVNTLQ